MKKFFEVVLARAYMATLTKKVYDFIQERITFQLIISLFAIAVTLLYAQRPHSFPFILLAMLWVCVLSTVLATGLLLRNFITERKCIDEQLLKGSTKTESNWFTLISCVTAVILTGVLLKSLVVPVILVGIFGVTVFYFRRTRYQYLGRVPVLASAILYAVTLALFVVYLRTAGGFITPQEPLDPLVSAIPSAYYEIESKLVYNKAHIRSAVTQFVFFLAAFLLLLLPAFAKIYPSRKLWLQSPLTPAAVFVAFASTIPIPPFAMDGAHWSHWIGPAHALLDGQWPYLDVFSYYAFLPIVILAGWISVFSSSPISLAILLSVLMFFSAIFVYVLIARHGRSHLAAFIGVSLVMLFANNHKSHIIVNSGALSFTLFTSVVTLLAFLFFAALKRGEKRAYFYAFFLGLLSTYTPSSGFFVLVGVTLVLTISAAKGNNLEKTKTRFAYATYIAGIFLLPAIALYARGSFEGVITSVGRIIDFHTIFIQGSGFTPQTFLPNYFLILVLVFTLTAYCVRFLILKRAMTPRFALSIFSLTLSVPFILQAIGRGPIMHNGILWLLLPTFLVLIARPLRFISHKTPPQAIAFTALAMFVVLSLGSKVIHLKNPVTILADRLDAITSGQESAIYKWALGCAAAKENKKSCSSVRPHTLAALYANEASFTFEKTPRFSRMIEECRKGTMIVDTLDSFVYQAGKCRPHHPYQSVFSISTKKQVDEYFQILSNSGSVFFGYTHFAFQQILIDKLKEKWLAKRRTQSTCDSAKANVSEFIASGLSDENRIRGIGLSDNPSILLDTDRDILCHIRPGMRLKFSVSGERIVNNIDGDSIKLIGLPLDPVADGYPNTIRIVQPK